MQRPETRQSFGRIEEATITAIVESTSGKTLQVDFGKDMTALIDTWQVVDY
jgi:molybdopterin-binding protein